jgi:gamma-tubulin complex component 5
MCLYFSDCFVAFAGDATHDHSRPSIELSRRHRSRRHRREQRNVIGFSQSIQYSLAEDTDSDENDDEVHALESSFSVVNATTVSFAEESFSSRLDKMGAELDGLVRFIRRGAESLGNGTPDIASAFGMFAFTLEDWDR